MKALISARVVATMAPLLTLVSCLRPAEERVRMDTRVGRAKTEGGEVTVARGHAVIRSFSRERLELWGSAPEFSMAISLTGSMPLELGIRNCMPDAALELRRGHARLVPLRGRLLTECAWRITPESGEAGDGPAMLQFELSAPGPDSEGFEFAVLSDIQDAIVEVQDVFQAMNSETELRFVLSTGDLTSRGQRSELERFQAELEGLEIPYFSTLGNHELGESPTLFHEYFGRGSSHFTFRGVHFSLLDAASATIDPAVYGWLEDWLEQGKGHTHVVAMHIPPLDPIGVRNGSFGSRAEAAKLLGRLASGDVALTLYGHIHSYYRFQNAGIEAHISGGGGAIPETFDGVGRHFLVVSLGSAGRLRGIRIVRVD